MNKYTMFLRFLIIDTSLPKTQVGEDSGISRSRWESKDAEAMQN